MNRKVENRIAGLAAMSRAELRQLWAQELKRVPPQTLGRDILALGIAYAWQERVQGWLSARIAKELDRLSRHLLQDAQLPARLPHRSPSPQTGTVLIREWQGTTHHVTVTADAFLWNGRSYPSLSGVARGITGTKWNGPRFIGLREPDKKDKSRHAA
jgi:hypothetical protein